MSPIPMKRLAAVVLAAALGMGGVTAAYAFDDDYLDRRDTVSRGAGDANATNLATQTIDPWPAYVRNTKITVDGKRAHIGMSRYQANKSIEPRGLTGTAGPVNSGNGNGNANAVSK